MNFSCKLIPALLLLALPACVLDKDLGDLPGATGEAPSTGGTASETSATDPTVTTGEPTQLCPNSDDFSCTTPYDCVGFPCGGLNDMFDADGCPRSHCSADKPCAAGEVCYDTGAWGTCNASSTFCEELDGSCSCSQTLDCHAVSYCVPAEIGPPADCFAISDAAACLAAGCSEASTVTPVTVVGDTCECGEPEVACLWFTQEEWGSQASPGSFYEIASGRVVVFPGSWIEVPQGWSSCDKGEAPAACACAETCAGL